MTKAEAKEAVQLAETMSGTYHQLAFEAADEIHEARTMGYKPHLTLKAIAALVRYQAMLMGGEWDTHELSATLAWLRPVLVVG